MSEEILMKSLKRKFHLLLALPKLLSDNILIQKKLLL